MTRNTEAQTLLAELAVVERYAQPAAALRELLDGLLRREDVNRHLADRISALDTAYPSTTPGADALVGRRMPDIDLTVRGSTATRLADLLTDGRFVLLDLTGGRDSRRLDPAHGWSGRVYTPDLTAHGHHPDLTEVTDVLVRPDGHIAWAARGTTADHPAALPCALRSWAGLPGPGSGRTT